VLGAVTSELAHSRTEPPSDHPTPRLGMEDPTFPSRVYDIFFILIPQLFKRKRHLLPLLQIRLFRCFPAERRCAGTELTAEYITAGAILHPRSPSPPPSPRRTLPPRRSSGDEDRRLLWARD